MLLPATTGSGASALVMDTSDWRLTAVVVVAELLPGTGSAVVLETDAELLMGNPSCMLGRTAATMVAVAEVPVASDVKVTVRLLPAPAQMPPPVEAQEMKLSSGGRLSVNVTDAASFGPTFVTVML